VARQHTALTRHLAPSMRRWGHVASSLFSRSLLGEQSQQSHNASRDHQGEGGPRKEEKESRGTPSTLLYGPMDEMKCKQMLIQRLEG
jgi:hypothetical protein